MLGSVFLHWDGLYESYHVFFSHLQCQLDGTSLSDIECGILDVVFRSDEEKAILTAMKVLSKFNPAFMLSPSHGKCTRSAAGLSWNKKNPLKIAILNDSFGPDGVSSADTSFDFRQRSNDIISKIE